MSETTASPRSTALNRATARGQIIGGGVYLVLALVDLALDRHFAGLQLWLLVLAVTMSVVGFVRLRRIDRCRRDARPRA